MANRAKPISNLQTSNVATSNDFIVLLVGNTTGGNTYTTTKISVNTFFSNTTVDMMTTANNKLSSNNFILRNQSTPANSTINIEKGTVFWDTNYLYIAVANNTLKRVALSSF